MEVFCLLECYESMCDLLIGVVYLRMGISIESGVLVSGVSVLGVGY